MKTTAKHNRPMESTPLQTPVRTLAVGFLPLAAALLLAGCGDKPAASGNLSNEEIAAKAERVDAAIRKAPSGAESRLPVRGTIHGRFDGQDLQWNITTLDDTSRFSAGTFGDGFMPLVILRADAAPGQPEGRFALELTFEGQGGFKAGSPPYRPLATLIPHKGIFPPQWQGDGMQVELTVARFDGQAGRVEGSFSGTLCYRADVAQNPDPSNCKPVEGRFASDLVAEPDY